MINIKNLDSSKIEMDEMSYKNIIYYIGYVTVKNLCYVTVNSVNLLYLFIDKTMETLKKTMEINI